MPTRRSRQIALLTLCLACSGCEHGGRDVHEGGDGGGGLLDASTGSGPRDDVGSDEDAGGGSEACTELTAGEPSTEETVVVAQDPPEPEGGQDLEGSYDLVQIELFVRGDASSTQRAECEQIAATDHPFGSEHTSRRLTARGALLELATVTETPRDDSVDQVVLLVRRSEDGLRLVPEVGTDECTHHSLPGRSTRSDAPVRPPGAGLPDDYFDGVTVTGDTLVMISAASYVPDARAPCARVRTFRRR